MGKPFYNNDQYVGLEKRYSTGISRLKEQTFVNSVRKFARSPNGSLFVAFKLSISFLHVLKLNSIVLIPSKFELLLNFSNRRSLLA